MLTWKTVRRTAKRVVAVSLAVALIPKIFAFYVVCGLADVSRNGRPKLATLERYFLGNGVLTWLLSPFNLLMDLLTLPYRNKGIYSLSDLPPSYQDEIETLLDAARSSHVIERLQDKIREQKRSMVFFKWYGKNLETTLDVPAFHQRFRHVRTIGVSVFNKQEETSEHFGPLRVTIRMLYNLNPIDDAGAYIEAKEKVHRWRDNPLFIFDDTLLHKSTNATDSYRYCLFVDLLRPSVLPPLMDAILYAVRVFSMRFNFVFYKNWRFIT